MAILPDLLWEITSTALWSEAVPLLYTLSPFVSHAPVRMAVAGVQALFVSNDHFRTDFFRPSVMIPKSMQFAWWVST